jgi:DNA-binding CsgD family transcriptional regulator/PAS domain-containing protein
MDFDDFAPSARRENARSKMRGLEPEILSSVISDIYDCALNAERWPAALGRVAEYANAAYATISMALPGQSNPVMAHHSAWDAQMLRSLNDDFGLELPGLKDVVFGELDMPQSTMAQMAEEEFQKSRFYKQWVEPQGLRDGCIAKFVQTAERIGLVAFITRADRDVINAEERRFLQLLSPHLRRAALIGDLLDQSLIAVSAYRAALDGFSTPVLLTDGSGRLKHANAAADDMLRLAEGLSLVAGQVIATSPHAKAALADAMARAGAEGGAELGGRGIGIPLTGPGMRPAVAHVLPLARSEVRTSLGPASVALFVARGTSHVPPTDSILVTLFDLTPAEARVMALVAPRRSLPEMAETLSVSANTVKTHLGRIYSKTGTTRQSELIALMEKIARP